VLVWLSLVRHRLEASGLAVFPRAGGSERLRAWLPLSTPDGVRPSVSTCGKGMMLHLVGPSEGTTISALGSTYTTKTDGAATGGAYSLVEEELWGDPTPLHAHTREEEAFYVLSGRLAVWVDGTETVAEPGTFLVIPRGVPHAARRVGDTPPRMLTLISPAGLQRFFEAVVREGGEELLGRPERLVALAAEFGSEILGDYPGA
jgi:mannose-6-phosphate isomerase-like protein (cupin superfamily)